MDVHCDDDWEQCPHAQALVAMYEAMEKKEMEKDKMIIELKHKVEALKKELRKTASMLGRSEKREKAKEEDIKELRKKNKYLESKYIEYSGKCRQYEANEQRIANQLNGIAGMYEARFAYLLDTFADGTFNEHDFNEWKKDKEYAIRFDEASGCFIVNVREVKENESGHKRPAAKDEGTGTAKAECTEAPGEKAGTESGTEGKEK
jgi:hypothetical protein